jgi:hypothetical protein
MKAKARAEKAVPNRVRSEKTSEKSKGGGRLDGKSITTNSKGKTKGKSEGIRKPF